MGVEVEGKSELQWLDALAYAGTQFFAISGKFDFPKMERGTWSG